METASYINRRLEHAAIGEPIRFPADAAALVHRMSSGIPRVIDIICDAALVFGYTEDRRTIDCALVQKVVRELASAGVLREKHSSPAPVPVAKPDRRVVKPALAHATQLLAAREADLLHQRDESVRRQKALSAREDALAERERQIAEQRRIMMEEYRLLRRGSRVGDRQSTRT